MRSIRRQRFRHGLLRQVRNCKSYQGADSCRTPRPMASGKGDTTLQRHTVRPHTRIIRLKCRSSNVGRIIRILVIVGPHQHSKWRDATDRSRYRSKSICNEQPIGGWDLKAGPLLVEVARFSESKTRFTAKRDNVIAIGFHVLWAWRWPV